MSATIPANIGADALVPPKELVQSDKDLRFGVCSAFNERGGVTYVPRDPRRSVVVIEG